MSWDLIREVGPWRFLGRFTQRQWEKRVLGRGRDLILPTGAPFHAPPWSRAGSEVIYTGCRVDWGADRLLLEHLDTGGSFLDVGANIGYYATLAAPRVRRVVAFEPDERNFDALRRNLSRLPNAEHMPKAVSAETGSAWFRPGRTAETGHLVLGEGKGRDTRPVETITLDRWQQDNPGDAVTAIKIDVEGFELDVLRGARALIRHHAPLILAEFNIGPECANDVAGLTAFTADMGYVIYGFLRTRPGRRVFRRLGPDDLAGDRFKMLFLCPKRLTAEFDRFGSA